MYQVLVTAIVRNNATWIPQFYAMVDNLRRNIPSIHFDTFVYENDSVDASKSMLRSNFYSATHGHPWDRRSRTKRLAFYRNDMKKHIKNIDSYDYTLMVDSEILFGHRAFEYLFETLQDDGGIAMVIPHAMVKHAVPCEFYYDTFAMKKKQFDSVVECTHTGAKHDRHCHRVNCGEFPIIRAEDPKITEVKYGFGGFVLIRQKFFTACEWGVLTETDCEHWLFCDAVRKMGGKIAMNRLSRVLWSE